LTSRPHCIPFIWFVLIAAVFNLSFAIDSARAERRPAVSQSSTPPAPSQSPIIVRNIRTWSSREVTRLVFDLNKPAAYEAQEPDQERVTVELKNAILSKSSRLRISEGAIPRPFLVSQSRPRSVTVVLPRRHLTNYKIFALSNPDRLVMDITHRPHEDMRPVGDLTTSPAAPAAPAAPAPVIPSPTVTDSAVSATGKPSRTVKTVVIDPGHGGKDPGTIGRHGTTEKEITLKIGLLLKDLLAKQPDTRVLMTRERDVFIELEDRAKFANSKEADLFISIHVNSHPHKGVRGLEIYHFGEAKDQRALEVAARENGTPLNSTGVGWEYLVADLLTSKKIENSLELAWTAKQAMVSRLNGRYSTIDHGVKTAPFYVLRFTTMPGILAEIAFMSNPAEEEQLRTSAFLTHLAESISDGIQAYLHPSRLTAR
jgi:N-acetylmuramoyl-L-alanine amidase